MIPGEVFFSSLSKIDEQLQTLSLGQYSSKFLDDLIAQLGIDPGKLYIFSKAKDIIARILEQQLKKKRNNILAELDRMLKENHAQL